MSKREILSQKVWEDRITQAKSVQDEWMKKFKVELARDYFEGQQNPGWPENEWITINNIYSHLKSYLPTLYSTDPYFYVKTRRSYSPNPADIESFDRKGKARAAFLNYIKEESKLKVKARLAIQDAQFSYGVLEVKYNTDLTPNVLAGKPAMSEDGLPLFNQDTGEMLFEPDYIPSNERYVYSRIKPDDFMWDADAGSLEDEWNYIFHKITTTYGEIKKHPKFDRAAIKSLFGGNRTQEDIEKDAKRKGKDFNIPSPIERKINSKTTKTPSDDTKIVYYKCWNLKNKTYSCIAFGASRPLLDNEPLPNGIERHPYAILIFTPRDDSPYPIPPISQGIDPCKEMNLARSRLLTHRKRFNRKYLATGPIEDEELNKLEVGDDGTVIRGVPGCDIRPITDAPLDQQGYLEIGYLKSDINTLLGSTEEARGIAGADSATQAGILDKRLEVKEGDAMSMVVDFIIDIARKMDQLIQANIDRDFAVKVIGPEGEFWQEIKSEDYEEINGEFAYSVNVGATLPRLPQMERASWQAFLSLLQGFPQLLLSRRLLKNMAEQHHIEDESMIDELFNLGRQMMSGQLPVPGGGQGSLPNVTEQNPSAIVGGQAGGPLSLLRPGAGNLE